MLEYIAEKVKGLSDTWDIVATPGGAPLLDVTPLDAQASSYPGSLNYGYAPWTGTQTEGGNFFDDLDSYAPETVIDHHAACQQVRKLATQSIELNKIINRNLSATVGRGLRTKPTPDYKIIGITLEQATEWGKDTGRRYHLWCKSKDSDVTGVNNYYQNQRFAWRQRKRDGEAFPRFYYSDDPKLMNPLQIGFIDRNQIRGDEFTFSSGPESQDDGLIKDSNGKVIAFKVWVTDPEKPGGFKDLTIQAVDKDTGLPLMCQMYEPILAGQSRGITPFFPAISDFEKITGYKTAALDRMKNGASRDYVIENEQADPSDMDLNALNPESAGVLAKQNTCEPATIIPQQPWSYNTIGGGQRTTGMVISGGRQGDQLKPAPDLSPADTSKDFIEFNSESASAAANMSPEYVNMKVNTSFTAAMGAQGLQHVESGIERDDLESDLDDKVYFAWLSGEIAGGRIQAIGWSDPVMRAAWLKKRVVGDPKIVLNPMQESKSAEMNVAMGRLDLSENAENFNGSDFETNAANLKKQVEILPTNSPIIKPPEVIEAEPDPDEDPDNNNDNGDEK